MKHLAAALILILALILPAGCGDSSLPEVPARPDLSEVERAVKEAVDESYARLVAEPTVENFERLARIAQAHGIDDVALQIWDGLIAKQGATFEREYLAGRINFKIDPDRARGYFEAARKLRPDYDALNLCLAEIYENAGDFEQAELLYKAALAGDRSGTATFGLGRIAFQRGEFAETLTLLERSLRVAPKHRPLLNLYAQVLFRLGREDESRAISDGLQADAEEGATRPLLINDPMMNDLYRLRVSHLGLTQLGEAAMSSGAFSVAADYYLRAYAARPDDRPLRLTAAECLRQAGRLSEAKKLFLEAKVDEPDNEALLYSLALTEFQLENTGEGVRILEDLKTRSPDNLEVRQMLAIAIWKTEPRAAINNLRYLLVKDPNNLRARLLLARIHFEAGRKAEGQAELQRIHAIDPNFVPAKELAAQFLGN